VKLHTEHGQEVICESRAHVLNYELSMMAWFSGCLARPIWAENGVLTWAAIEPEIRPLGPHRAPTGLIELENTNNLAGGSVYPQATLDEICDSAHERGLKVHLDGARIFNAAAYLGIPAARIAERCDTVMFCLSKGLAAPVGSLLAGSAQDISRGRLYRKRLGGGMRQAGVLAAAGLIALEEMPARLGEDHANAWFLADGLARIAGVRVLHEVQTNIVIFDVGGTGLTIREFSARLKARGVLINGVSGTEMRLVTHNDMGRPDCESALRALEEVAAGR
jgi:threonine aldolase